ncbi:MAG: hypothetical protein KME43_23970 [Myxacorys chilensis ATA2-1-KO14]|nr:hypothetical protein [Myxacorys chilensis ATA2-1-KO14]
MSCPTGTRTYEPGAFSFTRISRFYIALEPNRPNLLEDGLVESQFYLLEDRRHQRFGGLSSSQRSLVLIRSDSTIL